MSREGLVLSLSRGSRSLTGLLREAAADRVIVAIDPGKAVQPGVGYDRDGLVGEPMSLPTSRVGVDRLESVGDRRTARRCSRWRRPGRCIERGRSSSSGAGRGRCGCSRRLRRRRRRTQLGTRRFKTDDRDCAALVWLARQGAGQPANDSAVDALRAAVSHRRQLVLALKPLRQRLHDQLNALAPGLSAPKGHGRALALETTTRQGGARLRR